MSDCKTISANLNGVNLVFSEETGILTRMGSKRSGDIIKKGAGIIDVAWPLKEDGYKFEALRASADGKMKDGTKPVFDISESEVSVSWERLATNTVMPHYDSLDGGISATVSFKADEDGQSLIMSCSVTNNSDTQVRQVLFPDFRGLLPVAGHRDTKFTTLVGTRAPFVELADTPERRGFFAENKASAGEYLQAGGFFTTMGGRWYDFGGLDGGYSLYRKWWGWGPEDMNEMGRQDKCWIYFDHMRDNMRIAMLHYPVLNKGETFNSGDYVVTLHDGGWAEGVRPYEKWVEEHKNRVVPLPRKIRDGLGYRTCWMNEGFPEDPDSINRYYNEIPDMAKDMAEHGLYEMNLWGATSGERIPSNEETFLKDAFIPSMGGWEAWSDAMKKCKESGVNVSPFISWMCIWKNGLARYGLEAQASPEGSGWSETLKTIPAFVAPYIARYTCLQMTDGKNELHLSDVINGLRLFREKADITSVSWDQVFTAPDMLFPNLFKEFRRENHKKNPEAVFSGESLWCFEDDINYLDYTWNWGNWGKDYRPYIRVVKTTRPNFNVYGSPVEAKYCFMDNIFMNIYPTKPGECNGKSMISDMPEFSRTLKCLAALRKEYLKYFTEGELVGDCVLRQPCSNARITGYVLPESMLIIAVKSDADISYVSFDSERYLGKEDKCVIIKDIYGSVIYDGERFAKDELTLGGIAQDLFMIEIKNQ